MTVSSRYRGGLKPITFRWCIYFIDSVPHYLESKCYLHLFFFVKFTSKEGYVVAVNCTARQRGLGTHQRLHPSMLGTVCERCPAGCSVTKTISVPWSQAGRRAGSEGDELSSGLAK